MKMQVGQGALDMTGKLLGRMTIIVVCPPTRLFPLKVIVVFSPKNPEPVETEQRRTEGSVFVIGRRLVTRELLLLLLDNNSCIGVDVFAVVVGFVIF